MEHGGLRTGAGRKRGFSALKAEEARRIFAEKVAAEIEPLVDALIYKAKEGNIHAAHELFNRAWGKAPQLVSNAPEPITGVKVTIVDPEGRKIEGLNTPKPVESPLSSF